MRRVSIWKAGLSTGVVSRNDVGRQLCTICQRQFQSSTTRAYSSSGPRSTTEASKSDTRSSSHDEGSRHGVADGGKESGTVINGQSKTSGTFNLQSETDRSVRTQAARAGARSAGEIRQSTGTMPLLQRVVVDSPVNGGGLSTRRSSIIKRVINNTGSGGRVAPPTGVIDLRSHAAQPSSGQLTVQRVKSGPLVQRRQPQDDEMDSSRVGQVMGGAHAMRSRDFSERDGLPAPTRPLALDNELRRNQRRDAVVTDGEFELGAEDGNQFKRQLSSTKSRKNSADLAEADEESEMDNTANEEVHPGSLFSPSEVEYLVEQRRIQHGTQIPYQPPLLRREDFLGPNPSTLGVDYRGGGGDWSGGIAGAYGVLNSRIYETSDEQKQSSMKTLAERLLDGKYVLFRDEGHKAEVLDIANEISQSPANSKPGATKGETKSGAQNNSAEVVEFEGIGQMEQDLLVSRLFKGDVGPDSAELEPDEKNLAKIVRQQLSMNPSYLQKDAEMALKTVEALLKKSASKRPAARTS